MKTTDLVAWVGAITGLASLIWNIYAKVTANRPKLVVTAYADMIQRFITRSQDDLSRRRSFAAPDLIKA